MVEKITSVDDEARLLAQEDMWTVTALNLISRRQPVEGGPEIDYDAAMAGVRFGSLWAERYVADMAETGVPRDPASDRQAMLRAQKEVADMLERGDGVAPSVDLSNEAVMTVARDAFCFRFGLDKAEEVSQALGWSLEPYAGKLPVQRS